MHDQQQPVQLTRPALVLVAGCGDLGNGLAERCAGSAKLHVTGLRRSAVTTDYPVLLADLCAPDSLGGIPDQFDYLVYTATPGERSPAGYRAIYLQGLQNVLARLNGDRLKRVFFVSSTGVYGQDRGEWVDEDSPTDPSSFSGQILLEAEQWLQAQSVASTLVRFAGIYGPGRERLLRKVVEGCQAVQEPPYYTNRIHRDDCVGILQHLLLRAEAGAELPSVLVGVDQAPVSEWSVLSWLAEQLDCPAPHAVLGDGSQNKRCRSTWLTRLGYALKYPDFKAGYTALVADFQARRQ